MRLKDKWKSGPETYLGMMVHEFPNMLMLMGPHTALGNIPRSIEYSVDWVTAVPLRRKRLTRLEATPEGANPGPITSRRSALACFPTRSIPG